MCEARKLTPEQKRRKSEYRRIGGTPAEVDEKVLEKTGCSFKEEIDCVEQSGIILKNYQETEKCSEYEYVMFVWNTKTERYEQTGRPMINEWLARERFYEYVQNGWFNKVYDTNKAVMRRRMITTLKEKWEELEVNENE